MTWNTGLRPEDYAKITRANTNETRDPRGGWSGPGLGSKNHRRREKICGTTGTRGVGDPDGFEWGGPAGPWTGLRTLVPIGNGS